MSLQDPPVYALLVATPAVTELVGAATPSIFDGGYAPEGLRTYIVWQIVVGRPELYLSEASDASQVRVQVDCYAPDRVQAKALGAAVDSAFNGQAHQISQNFDERDAATKLYRWGMDFDFWLTD